jgi:hypothetical protein
MHEDSGCLLIQQQLETQWTEQTEGRALEVEEQPDAFFSRDCERLFALRSAIPTKHKVLLPFLKVVQHYYPQLKSTMLISEQLVHMLYQPSIDSRVLLFTRCCRRAYTWSLGQSCSCNWLEWLNVMLRKGRRDLNGEARALLGRIQSLISASDCKRAGCCT